MKGEFRFMQWHRHGAGMASEVMDEGSARDFAVRSGRDHGRPALFCDGAVWYEIEPRPGTICVLCEAVIKMRRDRGMSDI